MSDEDETIALRAEIVALLHHIEAAIDGMRADWAEMKATFDRIDGHQRNINGSLDKIEATFGQIEDRLGPEVA